MLAEARIGTTGFSYREWAGRAYPAGLTPVQMLAHYSSQLSGVEIAPPKLPAPETLASWAAAVPAGFEFSYVRIRRDDDQSEIWSEWADRLATLMRRGVDVYGFLKHDRKGISFDRARRLAMLLTAEEAAVPQQLLT